MNRRRLLALAPAGAAVLAAGACAGRRPRPRVDIRDHGARGDGSTDDSAAILAATAALTPGDTLHFPAGSYRFARRRPPARAAIALSGISDVAVEFAAGAELVMDNLEDGLGTSHGILVAGPATGITLRNIRIRWLDRPAQRSFGDGIRVVGLPGDTAPAGWTGAGGPVDGVRVLNCEVHSSPQAGVIMMGVSGIRVDGLVVRDTLADGLHFNACRRVTVSDHRAFDAGDDGLALVTYYADSFSYNPVAQTFSLPELGEWSNTDVRVTDVAVSGGRANGVRIAGANGVDLRWLRVSGKRSGAGVIVDSAAPGVDAGWFYLASRGVRLDRIAVEDCDMGLHLLARPAATPDRRFTDFDVQSRRITIRDCPSWGIRAESLTADRAAGLRVDSATVQARTVGGGNGGVGLQNVDGVVLGRVRLSHPDPVTVFSAVAAGTAVADLRVDITGPAAPEATAEPCVSFQDSDGRVDALTVDWPAAPGTWQPVRIAAGPGGCDAVEIAALSVPDTVDEPVLRC